MRELNIKELPSYPRAELTGEIGIRHDGRRWERNGQQRIGPIARLVLDLQPHNDSFIGAACTVTGWTPMRVLAFQAALGFIRVNWKGSGHEAQKGSTEANLYRLVYKLSRSKDRRGSGQELPNP